MGPVLKEEEKHCPNAGREKGKTGKEKERKRNREGKKPENCPSTEAYWQYPICNNIRLSQISVASSNEFECIIMVGCSHLERRQYALVIPSKHHCLTLALFDKYTEFPLLLTSRVFQAPQVFQGLPVHLVLREIL